MSAAPCQYSTMFPSQKNDFFPPSFQAADSTLVGMQPLLGMPFSDASARSVAASAGVLSSGDLEEGEGGMAGRRVGQDGKVMTAQDVLGLMLGNMRDLGEHKV